MPVRVIGIKYVQRKGLFSNQRVVLGKNRLCICAMGGEGFCLPTWAAVCLRVGYTVLSSGCDMISEY